MWSWKLVSWTSMGLVSILALAPLAGRDGAAQASRAPSGGTVELAVDVDGDGRTDRVRWVRYGDAFWLDVALAGAGARRDDLALASTTRVAPVGAGTSWSLRAADLNGDGRSDVLVRDGRGHTTAWLSDGRAFAAEPAHSPIL
jgi:hypothetical protein